MNKSSKFDPRNQQHRFQMLQLIHALAININTGLKTKINFFQHAKNLGWVDQSVRTKKQALRILVDQAVTGFGYVPKDRIKQALAAKVRKAKVAA